MATVAGVSIETYLRTEYEPDAEYVDTEIEARALGEDDHSSWQAAIQKWFFKHEEEWNVRVRPEQRVQTGPTRFRVPDLASSFLTNPSRPIRRSPSLKYSAPKTLSAVSVASFATTLAWVFPRYGSSIQRRAFSRASKMTSLLRRMDFHHADKEIEFELFEIANLAR